MTVPIDFLSASRDFEAFLLDARTNCGHETTHQAYHTTVGVFRAFRRRLTVAQGLRFADVLPPLMRAVFVDEWRPEEPPVTENDAAAVLRDVRAHGRHHNFAPDDAVSCVARAVLRHVDRRRFELVLRALPDWAAAFWGMSAVAEAERKPADAIEPKRSDGAAFRPPGRNDDAH